VAQLNVLANTIHDFERIVFTNVTNITHLPCV